jgi:hypothetical protein
LAADQNLDMKLIQHKDNAYAVVASEKIESLNLLTNHDTKEVVQVQKMVQIRSGLVLLVSKSRNIVICKLKCFKESIGDGICEG